MTAHPTPAASRTMMTPIPTRTPWLTPQRWVLAVMGLALLSTALILLADAGVPGWVCTA
jgi:hypothetical protein